MVHALIAFICCLFLPVVFYPAIAGFYIGREIAQAEYRVIEKYYGRHRNLMQWYDPFLPRAWTLKSFLDWFLPLLVVIGMTSCSSSIVEPIWWKYLMKLVSA